MKNCTYITAVISKIDDPEIHPEMPAGHHTGTAQSQPAMPPAPGAIEHTSLEAYASGHVEMAFMTGNGTETGYISIQVIVGFLFTCTKGKENFFTPSLNASLS